MDCNRGSYTQWYNKEFWNKQSDGRYQNLIGQQWCALLLTVPDGDLSGKGTSKYNGWIVQVMNKIETQDIT